MSNPDAHTFTLTALEAGHVVAALKLAMQHYKSRLLERDRVRMTELMQRLAAGLDLSDEVRLTLDG